MPQVQVQVHELPEHPLQDKDAVYGLAAMGRAPGLALRQGVRFTVAAPVVSEAYSCIRFRPRLTAAPPGRRVLATREVSDSYVQHARQDSNL